MSDGWRWRSCVGDLGLYALATVALGFVLTSTSCTGETVRSELGTGGRTGAAGAVGSAGSGSETGGAAGDAAGGVGQGGGPPSGMAVRISTQTLDKADLLFVIDNSSSMADKQELLERAVPQLVGRLADPICIDPETRRPSGDNQSSDGCSSGEPEFPLLSDIHIGVITSSLGGHGGVLCSPEHDEQYYNETQNDHARLIMRALDGSGVPTYEGLGFLSWDPAGTASNPGAAAGQSEVARLTATFQDLVSGAGEQGCGFEAPLEAWYRFLVDPQPPAEIERQIDPATGQEVSVPVGLDAVLLEQRAAFLRPDSLVAIIMLTDEDDCSVMDTQIGWFVGNTREGTMPWSTTVCDTDPNDPCCLSCIQANWPDGCSSPQNDPRCQQGQLRDVDQDRLNLRCFDQKRRFGLDFLYPPQRYVDGLTSPEVQAYDGTPYPNPLFAASDVYPDLIPRVDHSHVFLVGIVGVPWQDIATDQSLADAELLEYLNATDLAQMGIWEHILGEPTAHPPVPPLDPFMMASIEPRDGVNPRTGIPIDPPREGAGGNAINGHEYDIQRNSDLQYACIFPLLNPKDCANVEPGVGCDCKVSNEIFMRPLCNGTTQTYAKAYPAPRLLQVLREYGDSSVVASICPKNVALDPANPNYGYNPAMAALIDRARAVLRGGCLAQPLPIDPNTGRMACQVLEVTWPGREAPCSDELPGRAMVDEQTATLAREHLAAAQLCGPGRTACAELSLCLLKPVPDGADHQACLNDPAAEVSEAGYCYLDAWAQPDPIGNPELLADCPAPAARQIRFVNPQAAQLPLPWPGSTVLVLCPESV